MQQRRSAARPRSLRLFSLDPPGRPPLPPGPPLCLVHPGPQPSPPRRASSSQVPALASASPPTAGPYQPQHRADVSSSKRPSSGRDRPSAPGHSLPSCLPPPLHFDLCPRVCPIPPAFLSSLSPLARWFSLRRAQVSFLREDSCREEEIVLQRNRTKKGCVCVCVCVCVCKEIYYKELAQVTLEPERSLLVCTGRAGNLGELLFRSSVDWPSGLHLSHKHPLRHTRKAI